MVAISFAEASVNCADEFGLGFLKIFILVNVGLDVGAGYPAVFVVMETGVSSFRPGLLVEVYPVEGFTDKRAG